MSVSPEYSSWRNMKKRCTNVNNVEYPRYGGSGITVCARWLTSFKHFLEDMGPRPTGHSLDRIDSTKGYCPSNCRWANGVTQSRNQKVRRDNSSGIRGVSWCKRRKKWRVRIVATEGKRLELGFVDSLPAAKMMREFAERKYWK